MAYVLIIEDEESIRKMIADALTQAGVAVHEAHNGEEGLERISQERPSLILLDVIMPKMHGVEFLDRLQATEWGKAIPVILLTNYSDDPRVVTVVKEKRCELMKKEESRVAEIVHKVKEKMGM